jgi:hypothetical protein
MAPATGEIARKGSRKEMWTMPSTVAEPVLSKAQMVKANQLMLEARTEMSWPAQTIEKPSMPVGRLGAAG